MFHTYVISSLVKNYIYVGLTNNLQRRIKQHQQGKERTTRPYRPYKLILSDEFLTRIEARQREKFLKSGCGKEYLKNLVK